MLLQLSTWKWYSSMKACKWRSRSIQQAVDEEERENRSGKKSSEENSWLTKRRLTAKEKNEAAYHLTPLHGREGQVTDILCVSQSCSENEEKADCSNDIGWAHFLIYLPVQRSCNACHCDSLWNREEAVPSGGSSLRPVCWRVRVILAEPVTTLDCSGEKFHHFCCCPYCIVVEGILLMPLPCKWSQKADQ